MSDELTQEVIDNHKIRTKIKLSKYFSTKNHTKICDGEFDTTNGKLILYKDRGDGSRKVYARINLATSTPLPHPLKSSDLIVDDVKGRYWQLTFIKTDDNSQLVEKAVGAGNEWNDMFTDGSAELEKPTLKVKGSKNKSKAKAKKALVGYDDYYLFDNDETGFYGVDHQNAQFLDYDYYSSSPYSMDNQLIMTVSSVFIGVILLCCICICAVSIGAIGWYFTRMRRKYYLSGDTTIDIEAQNN